MRNVLKDTVYAARLLRRSPAFALTAVLTLAVGVGANAAIFSAVHGVLIAPLPYPEPEQLVRLYEETPKTRAWPMAPADFRDYRAELQSFAGIAAYMRNDLQLAEGDRAEQLRGMQVTAGFFQVLGHPLARGREFERTEEDGETNAVVVLSDAVWRRRFQADERILFVESFLLACACGYYSAPAVSDGPKRTSAATAAYAPASPTAPPARHSSPLRARRRASVLPSCRRGHSRPRCTG